MIFAGLLTAGALQAQDEQWLEYHVSNDGRTYSSLDLTTNIPPNVSLPAFKARPYFAFWKTPLDPAGGRWICLDRSRRNGPYDCLYVDNNGSGRLDDKAPALARLDSYNAFFPAAALTFKGEDGPITYHVLFRFYQYDRNEPRLLISSGGWYEGQVSFGGVKKRIQLIDGNVNGTFNDLGDDPYGSDRIQMMGANAQERFLGKLLELDGKLFKVEVARDGAFIKVAEAENVPLGSVKVPDDVSEFAAYGQNGHFVRKPDHGTFTLPEGSYRMVSWDINRKDEKGTPWTLSGYSFPKTAVFDVARDKPVTLAIGEPVHAQLKATESGRQITFNLSFVGQQEESIQMLRNNERPRGPRLMLANASGTLCYTNTFEFG